MTPSPELASKQLDVLVRVWREHERARPGKEVLSADRGVRRTALCTIYRELKASTLAKRKIATYRVGAIMLQYRAAKHASQNALPYAEIDAWFGQVARTASDLGALLQDERADVMGLTRTLQLPNDFNKWLDAVVARSSSAPRSRRLALEKAKLPTKGSRTTDFAIANLTEQVEWLSLAYVGKPARFGQRNSDLYLRRKVDGPFVRLMRAVFDLLGEPKSPEEIASAVRQRKRMGKTRRKRMGKPRRNPS